MSFLVTSSTAASTVAAQAEHLARKKNAAEARENARKHPQGGILRRVIDAFSAAICPRTSRRTTR